MVKHLMQDMNITDPVEAVRRINSREWVTVKGSPFRIKNGILHATIASDGMTGKEWFGFLETQGIHVEGNFSYALRTDALKTTTGTKYDIAIILPEYWEDQRNVPMSEIGQEATRNSCTQIQSYETLLLLQQRFSNELLRGLGLHSIVTLNMKHDTFPGEDGVGCSMRETSLFGIFSELIAIKEYKLMRDNVGYAFREIL